MTKETTTGRHQELIFCRETTSQPPACPGYVHAPRYVERFSAIQTKNPINRNESTSGMLRRRSVVVNSTLVLKNTTKTPAASIQRRSGTKWWEKKSR